LQPMTWPTGLEQPAVSTRRHLHPLPDTVQPCGARRDPLFAELTVADVEIPVADGDTSVLPIHIATWCIAGTIGWSLLLTAVWITLDVLA